DRHEIMELLLQHQSVDEPQHDVCHFIGTHGNAIPHPFDPALHIPIPPMHRPVPQHPCHATPAHHGRRDPARPIHAGRRARTEIHPPHTREDISTSLP